MPVIVSQNIKEKGTYNTMEFVIEDISHNEFRVNNKYFDTKEFAENFMHSFFVTVYKYQGVDINEH